MARGARRTDARPAAGHGSLSPSAQGRALPAAPQSCRLSSARCAVHRAPLRSAHSAFPGVPDAPGLPRGRAEAGPSLTPCPAQCAAAKNTSPRLATGAEGEERHKRATPWLRTNSRAEP